MSQNAPTVQVGGNKHLDAVLIGGGHPVVIQTMWKDRLSFQDLEGRSGEALVSRIQGLKEMGCGLLRFAIPDLESADIIGKLAGMVSMPLVADIHFDYKIALRCLDYPIGKIRINPGNIGGPDRVAKVLDKAAKNGVPIRIGVNGGSLPQDLRRSVEGGMDRGEALVAAAERELAIFREHNFNEVLVSLKASSPEETVKANRLFAERHDTPLHIGVTEAGPLIAGTVRNTVALYALLSQGIGGTIRVSLSDTMENEVIAGREILNALYDSQGVVTPGVRIVSCPRCGRNGFDTHGFTERWMGRLYALKKNIAVAVMGCAVNGPEEAKQADIGITGVGNRVMIFRHGKVIRTIDAAEADDAFREELEKL